MSCRDLNLVLYAPLFTALSRATMPPFSSALLPLSLKEIGGLGPTEGDCVSRLPTIVTLRGAQGRQWDICQICLCIALFPPSFLLSLTFARSCSPRVIVAGETVTICFSLGEKKRDGGVRKTESQGQRQESAAVLPVYPGLV